MQHSVSLEGLPVPSANKFILLGPFPDTADIGQKDNFALNYLELKVKGNRQVRIIGQKYSLDN